MKNLLYRPVIVIALLLGCLLVFEMIALGGMTWRNLQRMNAIENDITQGNHLRTLVFELQHRLMDRAGNKEGPPHESDDVQSLISDLIAASGGAASEATAKLGQIKRYLSGLEMGAQDDIEGALSLLRDILAQRTQEEEQLLQQVYTDTKLELKLALGAPVAVLVLTLLMGWFHLRRHVFRPLDNLKELLSRLTDGQFKPVAMGAIAPSLQPLFDNYNELVIRLSELEQEHRTHTLTLEQEVRNATHTVLDQSRTLARAERLAAVGELAASTAHELRNPLAGVQMALENMRRECQDEATAERFQMIGSELKRMTQRLNQLLANAQQTPEIARAIDVSRVIDELLALLRYQTDEQITLRSKVEPHMQAYLPETEFRQALLNLLLNATQALNEKRGTIVVTAREENGCWVFEVCDDGPGFPEALLQEGVRPFGSHRENGTGLGLLMVRRFAEQMGGRLELVNDPHGHACASLQLPATNRHA
jgi:signal transduction histidine kinase